MMITTAVSRVPSLKDLQLKSAVKLAKPCWTTLFDGSGAEAVVDLPVVVLVAAVDACFVRVAEVASLQMDVHLAQSKPGKSTVFILITN